MSPFGRMVSGWPTMQVELSDVSRDDVFLELLRIGDGTPQRTQLRYAAENL
jgi:hypothetical protein